MGEHYNFTNNNFVMNPYYTLNESPNNDEKNRVLGMVSVKYDITKNLSLQGRTGLDFWSHDRYRRVANWCCFT